MALALKSSGGGSVTIADPASTASNFTLNPPLANTTLVGTDATQTLSNKTFSGVTTFGTAQQSEPTGSAPLFQCRAWVNFNGTGTVAIRGSGNVSSITDNGVGDYTVNFSTAMSDANYSFSGAGRDSASTASVVALAGGATPTTTALRIVTVVPNISLRDTDYVNVSVFR